MSDAVSIQALVADTRELASLPEVVMRAMDMINDPHASAADIGRIISEDPGISARLLRLVNSPFYGFPSRIETISRAITIIGVLELVDLILATSVVKAFTGMPNHVISMDEFWEHSLYTGVTARALAARHRAPNNERFFVAGLLHDIGSLVVYRHAPDQAHEALRRARENGEVLHEAERELLGFDHAQVGAALMREWRLPEAYAQCAALHHEPLSAEDPYRLEVAMVHVADVIAATLGPPATSTGHAPPLVTAAWALIGFQEDAVEEIAVEADHQFAEAKGLLMPSTAAA